MAKAKEQWCGFCGKPQDEVVTLVEGPCINVCNECVDAMHELVHAPKPLLPVTQTAGKPKTVLSFAEEARKRGRR
jgi:ATP-dependent protease Clp ATPase subunit